MLFAQESDVKRGAPPGTSPRPSTGATGRREGLPSAHATHGGMPKCGDSLSERRHDHGSRIPEPSPRPRSDDRPLPFAQSWWPSSSAPDRLSRGQCSEKPREQTQGLPLVRRQAERAGSVTALRPNTKEADMAATTKGLGSDTAIRQFRIETPEADLEDLRARLAATRFPEKETVDDFSQGVPLATMTALARYWHDEYDWRKCEARLNAVPQFITHIGGLDIHFVHARSKHGDALPLIVTHGWPGSFIEQLKIVDL